MSTASRKTSRSTGIANNVKLGGITKLTNEASNRKSRTLTVDGESKFVLGNISVTPVGEVRPSTAAKKHSVSENVSTLLIDDILQNEPKFNHSQCQQTILKLEEQIKALLHERSELKIDIKVVSVELSLVKQEKEKIQNENNDLQISNDELSNANSLLSNDFESLTKEYTRKKEKWQNVKNVLEKALSEIRKELEDKIIEIRSKHKDEILNLEEKNRLLKVQLSDTLKVNSWERQHEIDRISGDLEKSLVNEENLRLQLKRLIPQLTGDTSSYCQNCRAEIPSVGVSEQKKVIRETELNLFKNTPNNIKRSTKDKVRLHKSADGTH